MESGCVNHESFFIMPHFFLSYSIMLFKLHFPPTYTTIVFVILIINVFNTFTYFNISAIIQYSLPNQEAQIYTQ